MIMLILIALFLLVVAPDLFGALLGLAFILFLLFLAGAFILTVLGFLGIAIIAL